MIDNNVYEVTTMPPKIKTTSKPKPKKKNSRSAKNSIDDEKTEPSVKENDDTELDFTVEGVEDKGEDNQSVSEGIDEQISVIDEQEKNYVEKKKQEIPKETYEYKPILEKKMIIVNDDNRVTSEVMSMFELAEIIGQRAKQIESGAVCYADTGDISDPISKAKIELKAKRCPLSILRQISEGIYEKWHCNEMTIEGLE